MLRNWFRKDYTSDWSEHGPGLKIGSAGARTEELEGFEETWKEETRTATLRDIDSFFGWISRADAPRGPAAAQRFSVLVWRWRGKMRNEA